MHKRQPFKTDHGVAAPVGEPVIAGDDGANVFAGGLCKDALFRTAAGQDDELIGGQHQLRGEPVRARSGAREEPFYPMTFRIEDRPGVDLQRFAGSTLATNAIASPGASVATKYPGL